MTLTRQQKRALDRQAVTPANVEAKAQRIASEIFALRVAVGAAAIIMARARAELDTPDASMPRREVVDAIGRFLIEWPVPPGAQ